MVLPALQLLGGSLSPYNPCYAMSGTEIRCARSQTPFASTSRAGTARSRPPIVLRRCYAMSGRGQTGRFRLRLLEARQCRRSSIAGMQQLDCHVAKSKTKPGELRTDRRVGPRNLRPRNADGTGAPQSQRQETAFSAQLVPAMRVCACTCCAAKSNRVPVQIVPGTPRKWFDCAVGFSTAQRARKAERTGRCVVRLRVQVESPWTETRESMD
eukprot:9848-Rhodomonas_salina.4